MQHDPNFYSVIAEQGPPGAAFLDSLLAEHPLRDFAGDWHGERMMRFLVVTMSPGDDPRFIYLVTDDPQEVVAFAGRAPFAGLRYWQTFVTPETVAELARLRPVAGLKFAP